MTSFQHLALIASEHPLLAPGITIALRAICVVFPPIPGLPIDLLAIVTFGALIGFSYAEAGIMLGAAIAFLAARRASASPRARANARLGQLAEVVRFQTTLKAEADQLRWWTLTRLVTNPLFDPLSYAGGLANARFAPFFVGSLLGNIPSMALFYIMASCALSAGSGLLLVAVVAFGLIIWLSTRQWLIWTFATQ